MEIALVNKTSLRIKGKTVTFVLNPHEKGPFNAALLLDDVFDYTNDETVVLQGPGDYEIGGVKIVGTRGEKGIVYSMTVDGIEVLVGKIDTLSAMQHKLKEHNIVVGLCNEQVDAAFLTSLAINAVAFYGEKAVETAQGFAKENVKQMNKYSVAPGKLPTEVETILLA
jgi:hypothetical protein